MTQRRNQWIGASIMIVVAMVVAACGGGSSPAQTDGSDQAAASGCPEPNSRMEVTSQELNLFVWTEYIPEDTIDCFEEVYGIKVNQDEYSSNEEMYAKLSAGGANYDLVQPTDYLVELMIRQEMLQELDKEKLSVMANWIRPTWVWPSTRTIHTRFPIRPAPMPLSNPDYAGRLIMLDDRGP